MFLMVFRFFLSVSVMPSEWKGRVASQRERANVRTKPRHQLTKVKRVPTRTSDAGVYVFLLSQ